MTDKQLTTLTETADDLEHAGAVVMLDDLRALLAERHALREALHEIMTDAHCIAKAGPLSVPTLDVAWNRFMHISARAASALHRPQTPALVEAVTEAQTHNHEKPLHLD